MKTFVTGLCLFGLTFLLIWLFDIQVGDGIWGAGLASIPAIIGAYLMWAPIRNLFTLEDD